VPTLPTLLCRNLNSEVQHLVVTAVPRPHYLSQLQNTMSTTKLASRPEVLLSRREIEGLIAEGKSIIIIDQMVLKVDPWLKYHPGGEKAIMHVVGRDATDEVNG
jgi:hypothetical protein